MQEIFKTSDPAQISLIKSLLTSARIRFFVFGEELIAGAIGATSDCRFMVLPDDAEEATNILEEAGLFAEEEYVDILATMNKADAERAQDLLDEVEIDSIIEEDRPDEGLIPGVGDKPPIYYLVVLEGDFDGACDTLERAGFHLDFDTQGTA